MVRKYKAGTLNTDARWINILEESVEDSVIKGNCCCPIFCRFSCFWICYKFCPGKIKEETKCFHAIGQFLSLFLSLPLVPVNKVVEAFWQIRLHFNEKAKREATEEEKNDPDESKRKTDDDYVQAYKKEKERLANKLDNNTSQVNIGIVIESSLEATFQYH